MKRRLNNQQKLVAYILNQDPDLGSCSTSSIGQLFNVSQSTAYNAVKEVKIARKISDLELELNAAKEESKRLLVSLQKNDDSDWIQVVSRKKLGIEQGVETPKKNLLSIDTE